MKILVDSAVESLPEASTIFLDNNVLLTGLRTSDYENKVITRLRNYKYSLAVTEDVYWEFIRGSGNVVGLKRRKEFIEALCSSFPSIPKRLDRASVIMLAFHAACKEMSYVDLTQAVSLAINSEAFILTQNHKHFPLNVFDRKVMITVDNGREIFNHAIYGINQEKFKNILDSLQN